MNRICGSVALLSVTAVCLTSGTNQARGQSESKDIVDTAVAAGNFDTLVAAVKAAGLAETLKSPGPFTVFAPTEKAFKQTAGGDASVAAETGEQRPTQSDLDLPRRARTGDCPRSVWPEQRRVRSTDNGLTSLDGMENS